MRPRAETEHNFSLQRRITFPPPGSPLPRSMFLSLSQLLHYLSLISLFPVLFSPSPSFTISISRSPAHLLLHLFLAVCFLPALPASLHLFCLNTPRGISHSAVGLELEASFIEFAQGPGKAYLPIRSWWGASSVGANPQIPLRPACVRLYVCISHLPLLHIRFLDA